MLLAGIEKGVDLMGVLPEVADNDTYIVLKF